MADDRFGAVCWVELARPAGQASEVGAETLQLCDAVVDLGGVVHDHLEHVSAGHLTA